MTAVGSQDVGDQLELAMGLISNAADWRLAGPPEQDTQSAEWVRAAQRWLATYQAWLRQHLAEIRGAAEAAQPALQAQLAAESLAGVSEGGSPPETGTDDLSPSFGRRFALQCHRDVTGISGTGTVAYGFQWPDGQVMIRWRGARPSTVLWDSVDDAMAIHGHGGATELHWIDPQ